MPTSSSTNKSKIRVYLLLEVYDDERPPRLIDCFVTEDMAEQCGT